MNLTPRQIYLGTFVVCTGLIGFGLFLQHARGLEPCPMCILQRYAFVVTGAIALVAALHNPQRTGRWIYSVLILLAAGFGAGVAIRHVYLEHNPPQIFDCGADLGFLMESFPLAEALPMIFRGTGDCSKVLWRFLGLSIAEWALIWFALFIVAAIIAAVMKPPRRGMFGRP
jgi:protein dithiol:quinone oxidoreductase